MLHKKHCQCEIDNTSNHDLFKGMVHPKINILSSLTHPHVISSV